MENCTFLDNIAKMVRTIKKDKEYIEKTLLHLEKDGGVIVLFEDNDFLTVQNCIFNDNVANVVCSSDKKDLIHFLFKNNFSMEES